MKTKYTIQEGKIIKFSEKSLLSEKLFKTIRKKDVSNKLLWQCPSDKINVYIFPDSKNEFEDAMLNDFETIRIGITEDGKVLFWNGLVLHSAVAQALKIGDFFLRLTKEKKNKFFTTSSTEMGDLKQFKKYIMTDKAYEKGMKVLKKMFPATSHMIIFGEKIEI